MPNNTKAFTLIEILIVVAIVGILSGIVVVSMSDSQEKARIAKIKGFSDSLRSSMLTSLVSEWKLDENTGTTATDSWGSNDGTLTNDPVWKTGSECVSGSCLQFDGVDDYVDCGDISSLGQEFTIEIWSYRQGDSSTTYSSLFSIDIASWSSPTGGLQLWDDKSGAIYMRLRNDVDNSETSISFESDVPDNKWRHYVFTFDRPYATSYTNGVLYDSITWDHDVGWNTFETFIGQSWSNSKFNGTIDTVRIYNQALTSSAIQQNYLAGLDSLLTNQSITQQEYDNRVSNLNNYAQQY